MNFLTSKIEQSDAGKTVNILGADAPVDHLNTGGVSDVIVGLRPEHIELGQGKVNIKATPSLVESLGSEKYVYFSGGDQQVNRGGETEEDNTKGLIARVTHSGRMAEGVEIELSFDPQNLYLFDATTEAALR